MNMRKITFTGSFGEYFIMSLGLLVLSVITCGIALPYWLYWSYKYFVTHLELEGSKIFFNGSFGDFFIMSLGLLLFSILTFGIALPYWVYWQSKYFFSHLEVEPSSVQKVMD